jgi:hypothetical protein
MSRRESEHHRRTGEIVRALFEIVMRQPGIKRAEALDQLEARMHLNDAEIRRANWGTTGATKAGWFQKKPRGCWTVTSEGQRAFAQFAVPEAFHRELARLYREWDQNQGESRK